MRDYPNLTFNKFSFRVFLSKHIDTYNHTVFLAVFLKITIILVTYTTHDYKSVQCAQNSEMINFLISICVFVVVMH